MVVMGSLMLNTTTNSTVYRNVSKIIVHENYTVNFVNDIAIMLFNDSLIFNEAVRPIRMADRGVNDLTMCEVSGWGSTAYVSSAIKIMAFTNNRQYEN